ncbi:hypothetical protein P8452_33724 [Trifolium repens]|nr:hypothetical protein P8452_33724 [Trifolium repens]
MLGCLVKCNRLDDAVCLFKEIVRLNFNVDRFTFNILIRGFCVAGEIDEAFRINEVDRGRELLKEVGLGSEFGPKLNGVSYTIVISGYC